MPDSELEDALRRLTALEGHALRARERSVRVQGVRRIALAQATKVAATEGKEA